jgi:hypothetical protein
LPVPPLPLTTCSRWLVSRLTLRPYAVGLTVRPVIGGLTLGVAR